MKSYVVELIGTFFLVLTIGLTVNQGLALAPLAIGVVLAAMVYVGGHISGAQYNPAVSLAAWIRGVLKGKDVLPYWVAQFIGAILASFAVLHLTGKALHVAPTADWPMALLAETLFTFALVLVIQSVATAKATTGNSFYGLAIGFTVMGGAFSLGGISGAAFNPAVGLSPAVVELMMGQSVTPQIWIYLVGPLVGGALAAYTFKYLHPGE